MSPVTKRKTRNTVTLSKKKYEELKKGAKIYYNDPHVPKITKMRKHDIQLNSSELTEELLASMDAVVIITDHSAYDFKWIVNNAKLVIDTRNATKNVTEGRNKIIKA